MSRAIENLEAALRRAMAGRPKIGGFPYLAETLRRAGVTRNVWTLPAGQSLYVTKDGSVVTQGTPLASGTVDVRPLRRCEPIRLATARFLSSLPPRGVRELSATTSIS